MPNYILAFSVTLLLFPLTPIKTAAQQIPFGYSSVEKEDLPSQNAILSNPLVTAISLRSKWTTVETNENVYNWSFLDSEINRASLANKSVILRVISGGVTVPNWVYNKGVQSFSFVEDQKQVFMAIPWDRVMLKYKKELIEAEGKRYTNNLTIKVVDASCANSSSGDWHLPDTPIDIINWQNAGYTPDKLLHAGEQIIDTTMAAFPNQAVTMSFNSNNLDKVATNPNPTPNYVQKLLKLEALQ